MKGLALAVGLLITAAGVAVIAFPSAVLSFAQHTVTPLELYASALIRIGIGILLTLAAPASHMPGLLRVFGVLAVIAGVATLFLGVEQARTIADWVTNQGPGRVRVFGLLAFGIGITIGYACRPVRRGLTSARS